MLVLKHSLLNLKRRKKENLSMGIFLLFFIWLILLMTTIYLSCKQYVKQYSKEFELVVTIIDNNENNATHEKKLTKKQYLEFGKSTYVKKIYLSANLPVSFVGTIVLDNEKSDYLIGKGIVGSLVGMDEEQRKKLFLQSGKTIIEGKETLASNECMIEEAYAQANQITCGDKLTFQLLEEAGSKTQELYVAAIYQEKTLEKQERIKETGQKMIITEGNQLITTMETVTKMGTFEQYGYHKASYQLTSKKAQKAFKAELSDEGLSQDWQLKTNENDLNFFFEYHK